MLGEKVQNYERTPKEYEPTVQQYVTFISVGAKSGKKRVTIGTIPLGVPRVFMELAIRPVCKDLFLF